MVRRVNRGSGNALGVIAIALTATFWIPIALVLFLVWLPLWAYLSAAAIGLLVFIIKEVNSLPNDSEEKL